jgi:glycosyltransferase involved in cell wall biosynthesis
VQVFFAIPGDPDTLTGGYVYDKRVSEALTRAGWTVKPLRLPESYPQPSADDLSESRRLLTQVPEDAVVLIDGLAFGAMPASLFEGLDLRIVALVHHPLALETGVSPARADQLRQSEKAALTLARAVITTSVSTADELVRNYGVPRSSITVAMPGTDRAERARGSVPPVLLTVASVTPRKGYDVLVPALARIRDLAWRSVIVGSLSRDAATGKMVQSMIATEKLADRIDLKGELPPWAIEADYRSADVFVLPSRHEGYGMVFAEALAHGLPIVACAAGAVTDTVPTDAGLLVPPDDPGAVAEALRRLLMDDGLRRRLSDAAWSHGQRLPRWEDTARQVAQALRSAAA